MKRAKSKHDRRPAGGTHDEYVEASKDAFAFVHLMELVDSMTQEIVQLREVVESVGGFQEEEEEKSPVSGAFGSRKQYLN